MRNCPLDDDVSKAIERLVTLADAKLYEILGMTKPIMESGLLAYNQRQILSWLSVACMRASGSTLALVNLQRLWDAEIVSRSVFEGTVKFCHILGDPEKAASRFEEYEHALSDINSLADHEKARRALECAPLQGKEGMTSIRGLLLPDSKMAEIKEKYPSSIRRRLQLAWGVTGMIEQMVNAAEGFGETAAGLLHGYAIASHVAHADYLGIGMMMEREHRSPERRSAIQLAHAARLISDQLWFCALRLIVGYRFINEPEAKIKEVMQDGSEIWANLREAHVAFHKIEYMDL